MDLKVFDLGLISFYEAWQFQKKIFEYVKENKDKGAIIFCRHFPVITLGRKANLNNLLVSQEFLKENKIDFFHIDRGGDITYHGPGQIIVYPILNLSFFKKDISYFLRFLEELVVVFLRDLGIKATTYKGLTGVWIEKRKIASLGIGIKNWITFHGLSINIKKNDLLNFKLIRPCGMDIEVTSLETVMDKEISIEEIKEELKIRFHTTILAKLTKLTKDTLVKDTDTADYFDFDPVSRLAR